MWPRDGQFIDLPLPVQALQLCTALIEGGSSQVAAEEITVGDNGTCRLSTDQGMVTAETVHLSIEHYSDKIAGRPAQVSSTVVSVRLRDDAPIGLNVSAPDSVALAEVLVPLLVRN
jgi:hypothetical protein